MTAKKTESVCYKRMPDKISDFAKTIALTNDYQLLKSDFEKR